jgi:hypothetical protein
MEVNMRRQEAPYGWSFQSADFSLQAHGKNCYGTVTFIRNDEERELWHKLADDVKESVNCPELYVTGRGATIEEAVADANTKIAIIPLLGEVEQ